MEWYLILIIVFFLLLFLMFVPLCFKFKFKLDVLQNMGAVSVCLFGIPIKNFRFNFFKKGINLIFKNKTKQKIFNLKKIKFFQKFFAFVFFQTKFFNFYFITSFGYKKDAFLSAVISGLFLNFMNFFEIFLHTKKEIKAMVFRLYPSFSTDEFEIKLKTSFAFNLYSVLIGLLLAKQKQVEVKK